MPQWPAQLVLFDIDRVHGCVYNIQISSDAHAWHAAKVMTGADAVLDLYKADVKMIVYAWML